MNFALMFALALGIDYALFIVARYRAALFGAGLSPVEFLFGLKKPAEGFRNLDRGAEDVPA